MRSDIKPSCRCGHREHRNSACPTRVGARLLALRRYCWGGCSDRSGSTEGRRPTRGHDGRACACSLLWPSALRLLVAWGRASQTPESTHNAYPTRAAGRGRSPRLSGPGRVSPRPVFLAAGTAVEYSPGCRRRRYRKSHVVRKCTQNYELARLQREEEGEARR